MSLSYDQFIETITKDVTILRTFFEKRLLSQDELNDMAQCLDFLTCSIGTQTVFLEELFKLEFEMESKSKAGAILRSNTLTMKILDYYMKRELAEYLRGLLCPIIQPIIDNHLGLEIDPSRLKEEDETVQQENIEKLSVLLKDVIERVFSKEAIQKCPFPIKYTATIIKNLSESYGLNAHALVGSFILLRMINPVIIFPIERGIKPSSGDSKLSDSARRTLLLLIKLIQALANNVPLGEKERFMECMQPTISELQDSFNKSMFLFCLDDEELAEHQKILGNLIDRRVAMKTVSDSRELKAMAERVHFLIFKRSDKIIELLDDDQAEYLMMLLEDLPKIAGMNDISLGSEKQQESDSKYEALLAKAQQEDLSDIEALNLLKIRGHDKDGRPIAIFTECGLPKEKLHRVLLYFIRTLDSFVNQDYVLVYCINNQKNQKRPGFQWMLNVYRTITRKYKKNLKNLYMIHPIWIYKVLIKFFRPFVSDKFWRKLHLYTNLERMWSDIDPEQVPLAPHVLHHNIMINKSSGNITPVFGVDYIELLKRSENQKRTIPFFLLQFLNRIEFCKNTEGLFRKPGKHSEIMMIKNLIDHGYVVDLDFVDIHAICSVVKLYFRELPVALLCTQDLYKEFMDISQPLASIDVQALREVVHKLPKESFALAKYLFEVLNFLAQNELRNKMTAQNLATCIGPNILTHELKNPMEAVEDIGKGSNIVAALIIHCTAVFS